MKPNMYKEKNKEKGSFNKREYKKKIHKKHIGSQQEGYGEAFCQKKAVIKQYYRMQKKENRKLVKEQNGNNKSKDILEEMQMAGTSNSVEVTKDESPEELQLKAKKTRGFQRAKLEFEKVKAERAKLKEEKIKRREEINNARKQFKEKRLHRYKQLNKKTKKGQPVMSGRIELMVESLMKEKNLV